jgi:AraC-like DNA-binding protein
MSTLSRLASQFFDASLRASLVDAGNVRLMVYDTGWRMLPYTLICQWHQGCAIHECEGAEAMMVQQGEAMVIPAGTFHRTSNYDNRNSIVRWTHMRFSIFEAIDLISLLEIPLIISPPASHRLGDICGALYEIVMSVSDGWMLPSLTKKKALEMEMLAEIAALAAPISTSIDHLGRVQHLSPVLQFIEDHLAEPLPRTTLADVIHLSPGYFDALFKRTMQMTPQEYIKRFRIRRAQELLIHTDLPVTAVAGNVGYNDPFHFSRQFRSVCGISPAGYRNQFKAKAFPHPFLEMRKGHLLA